VSLAGLLVTILPQLRPTEHPPAAAAPIRQYTHTQRERHTHTYLVHTRTHTHTHTHTPTPTYAQPTDTHTADRHGASKPTLPSHHPPSAPSLPTLARCWFPPARSPPISIPFSNLRLLSLSLWAEIARLLFSLPPTLSKSHPSVAQQLGSRRLCSGSLPADCRERRVTTPTIPNVVSTDKLCKLLCAGSRERDCAARPTLPSYLSLLPTCLPACLACLTYAVG